MFIVVSFHRGAICVIRPRIVVHTVVWAFFVLKLGVPAGAVNALPLVIGETFTMDSKILGETRRMNVYIPPGYAESPSTRLPVLYRFAAILTQNAPPSVHWHYERMPDEKHSTIYHPAALKAFRYVFKPHTDE